MAYRNKPQFIRTEREKIKLAAGTFNKLTFQGDDIPMVKKEPFGPSVIKAGTELQAVYWLSGQMTQYQ